MRVRGLFVLCFLVGLALPVAGQGVDSAMYVVRLGVDTVAVERWTRTADSLHVVAVTRSPRVNVRRYVARFDSAGRVLNVSTGAAGVESIATSGAVPIAGGTYAPYAVAVWYAMRAGAPETLVPMRAGSNTSDFSVQRVDVGQYTMPNQFGAQMSVQVASDGTVTSIDAGGGTTVERVAPFDFEALTRAFAERDRSGTGLGQLSPRDTARAVIAGANVVIDYGRPSARGRTVMGGLVPYDAVWRTGANAATQLITDAPLRVGDVRLEPGSYSLFTIPRAGAWDLIINRQTEISGLEHDPAHDVGRVRMQSASLSSHTEQFTVRLEPEGNGGRLRIMWGDADMSVAIRR
jgi:hypothetical protein